MNILELGAIGERVGGVSVREAVRALLGGIQWLRQPGIAEVWLRGMARFESLESGDRLRFAALLLHLMRVFEGANGAFEARSEG